MTNPTCNVLLDSAPKMSAAKTSVAIALTEKMATLTAASAKPNSPQIGVFGGAFDPPHLAHLALAQAAVQQFDLARLYIVPTGQAWHKARPLSDAHHRQAMCDLAFANLAQAVVEPMELLRPEPSYSIDTVSALQARHPDAQFKLFIGLDQAFQFHTWRCWQDLATLAQIVVVWRGDGADADADADEPAHWLETVKTRCAGWPVPLQPLASLAMPPMAISSTQIRAQVATNASHWQQRVASSVAHYVQMHKLYKAQ